MPASNSPPPEEAELRARLAALPVFAGRTASLAIEPLGGLTNRSVRVRDGGDSYAFRLPGSGTASFLDRAAEMHNASLAAGLGIAPEVLFFDPSNGAMLTRFHEARPLDAAALKDPETLRRAVLVLKRLHTSAAPFRGTMDLFGKLAQYLLLAEAAGAPAEPSLMRGVAEAQPVRSALAVRAGPLAPCHIDPTPHNFIASSDGSLLLVDWEYAAMAEPLWDLADLSAEASFGAEQEAAALAIHQGAVSSRSLARLSLYKVGLHLLAAAWAHLQPALGNLGHDFEAISSERLNTARTLMGRPAFREALGAAG